MPNAASIGGFEWPGTLLAATSIGGFGTLAALLAVMATSIWLGARAQAMVEKGRFMQGYFLGNRDLGSWALALSATVQSGGTFIGFPALVYGHGWSAGLWIAGYMVVPLTAFALLGKRLAQTSRATGALTVPDLFRLRFESPMLGLTASLLVLYLLLFTMVAQFKAGALVMKLAWPNSAAMALVEDDAPPPAAQASEPTATAAASTPPAASSAAASSAAPAPTAAATPALSTKEKGIDWPYLVGLLLFAGTVVAYTLCGGFTASVWADVFQSILMLIGVVVLLGCVYFAGQGLEASSRAGAAAAGPMFVQPEGYAPSRPEGMFLPWTAAASMFFIWVCGGISSPASIVRMMACRDSQTLRRSIVILGAYNLCIYPPLILICIMARGLLPHLETADEVIPRMALEATKGFPGGSLVAGLILAAPFGAVMASVSCFLLVISSGLVHDLYQRFVRPQATEVELRRATTIVMVGLGTAAVLASLRPIPYLQMLVFFSAASGAGAFFAPLVLSLYWRRATASGVLAAMLGGTLTTAALWGTGLHLYGEARPYLPFGFDPVLWALAASFVLGISVSLATRPPREEWIHKLFPTPSR